MSKNKLKIAIFHLAFVYSGGGEKLVLEETINLRKKGHEVDLYAPVADKNRCYPDLLNKVGVKTFLSNLPHFIPEWESYQIILVCILAPFLAYKFRKFDVIFAANQPSPWLAFWVKLIFGVPYVSYLAQPTRFLYPRKIDLENGLTFISKRSISIATLLLKLSRFVTYCLDRMSIRYSDKILANGEYIKKVLERTYGIEAISCPAGAYPISRLARYNTRLSGKIKIGERIIQKPYVLLTNRHFSQKKFEYAITAFSSIFQANPNMSLVITGGVTSYTLMLKNLTKELSLEEKVFFLGLVKEEDLKRLYVNASLYVYTAPEEDFGMGIVEAMVVGTPVVAWNSAGPSKIIVSGKTGLLAEPYNFVDFTRKMLLMVRNINLAENLGKSGWLESKTKYSYKAHCDIIEEFVRMVTDK